MIGTIRKHSTWLWIVIICVTVFTFVYWGSNTQRYGDTSRAGSLGVIDGQPVTPEERAEAYSEAYLRYFLNRGAWPKRGPNSDFNENLQTYQRLFLIRKLEQHKIQVDSKSVAQAVSQLLRSIGGGDRSVSFDTFVNQVLKPQRLTEQDLERFVRHELGIQQLVSVVALSGRLVPPDQARFLYERDHQQYSAQAAFFSATNYLNHVTNVTETAVAEFYTNQMSAYRIPERVQVDVVAFEITNYLAGAERALTNLTEDVEQQFTQLGTNYLRFGDTPDAVKARIREEMLRRQAVSDAYQDAVDFQSQLLDLGEQASNLVVLAQTSGLKVKTPEPFDEQQGPAEFDGGPSFAQAAFSLSADRPFPDEPVIGEEAVYVMAFKDRSEPRILPLNEIRARVTADFKRHQAVMLAREAGMDFIQSATNGLVAGKTFSSVCQEADARFMTLPFFSLTTTELPGVEGLVDLNHFKQVTASTPVGSVSQFTPTPDGGFVVYVSQRIPPNPTRMAAELPEFLDLIRRAREQEAFSIWTSKEGSISLQHTPLTQPEEG